MIKFNEYKNGTWTIRGIDDYGKAADSLRSYATNHGDKFDDDEIQTLIEDYDFIATGRYLKEDLHFENLIRDFRESIESEDIHEKTLARAFLRLLKENQKNLILELHVKPNMHQE